MAGSVSKDTRRKLIHWVAKRYRTATRTEKGRILDEFGKLFTPWFHMPFPRTMRWIMGARPLSQECPTHRCLATALFASYRTGEESLHLKGCH